MTLLRPLFISFLIITFSSCKEEGTWIQFKYDEARAYYYSYYQQGTHGRSEVLVNGKLNPTILNPEGAELDSEQIRLLGHALNGNKNEGPAMPAECYIPHHGIVFYNKSEIVAHISICFMCDRIESVPANHLNQTKILEPIFEELGIPISPEEF